MPIAKPCFPLNRTCTHLRHFKQDIRLNGIRSVHFLKSEWENFQPENAVSKKYLIYRGLFCAILVFIVIFSVSCTMERPYYLIYLTHWNIISQNVYSFLFFIRVLMGWVKYRKVMQRVGPQEDLQTAEAQRGEDLPINQKLKLNCLEKAIWFLNCSSFVLPFIVTLGFWLFLVPSNPEGFIKNVKAAACYLPATSMVHGLNFILGTIDVMIIAVPVRITHALYLSLFAFIYLIFSGLYEVAGGRYPPFLNVTAKKMQNGTAIYGFLNWKETPNAAAISSVFACFAGLFFYVVVYLLYALRLFLVSFYKPKVYAEHSYDFDGNDRDGALDQVDIIITSPSVIPIEGSGSGPIENIESVSATETESVYAEDEFPLSVTPSIASHKKPKKKRSKHAEDQFPLSPSPSVAKSKSSNKKPKKKHSKHKIEKPKSKSKVPK